VAEEAAEYGCSVSYWEVWDLKTSVIHWTMKYVVGKMLAEPESMFDCGRELALQGF
jgi:hypothetical protein